MDKILIVDASPLIYAVYDTQGHLSTSSGEPTGLRYGFLRSVRSYKERTKCNKVVLAFDTKGPIKKAEGLETYKANREFTETKANMYSQVPALRELIELTNWTQIEAPGYEADDIIGAVARAKSQRGDHIVIVTPDNDAAQLVNDRVNIFTPGKKGAKDTYKRAEDIKEYFGVWPEQLLVWRAICGDKSDNIEGIGLEKSACEAIKNVLLKLPRVTITPEIFQEQVVPKLEPSLQEKFEHMHACRDKFDLNLRAMQLHRPEEMTITKGRGDAKAMEELFHKLEFKSMFKYIPDLTGEQA